MASLERTPGVNNWIERLDPVLKLRWRRSIIHRAAEHMVSEHGMEVGHAIASAINWARHVCDTGDVKQWRGPQQVSPKSRAECCNAVTVWEQMKAANKA